MLKPKKTTKKSTKKVSKKTKSTKRRKNPSLEDTLNFYEDKNLELWYLKRGKFMKQRGRVVKQQNEWILYVPTTSGTNYELFPLNENSVKLEYKPYTHLVWQRGDVDPPIKFRR